MPTFESGVQNGAPVYGLVLLKPGSWLQHLTIQVSDTYEQPTFAEPGFVMRNVNRVAVARGYQAGWPTFVPDDPTWPPGRVNTYNCYFVPAGVTQVTWQQFPPPPTCRWSRSIAGQAVSATASTARIDRWRAWSTAITPHSMVAKPGLPTAVAACAPASVGR